MIAFVCFLAGLLLGGCVALGFLSAFQLNRINKYEQEINKLRAINCSAEKTDIF